MAKEHRPDTSTPPEEESVFSRIMNTRVAQVNRTPREQIAAVIVFKKGAAMDEVNAAILKMGEIVESSDLQEFTPEYGLPVLYFP